MEKSKRIFLIFTAIFLGIVLLVGIVLGTVSIIKGALSVMNYKGTYLYRGMANYLSATFKHDFMATLRKSGVDCYDGESFWNTDAGEGLTYGQLLQENTENYLRSVLVGSYLFDRNTKLSKNDKKVIEKSVAEVLDYKAGGDVDKFNEISADMGFTYKDFKKVATLLYKAEMAETVIFGFDGAALSSGSFTEECNEYFNANYVRVRLLIIRTDGKLVTNSETGKQELQEYTDEEREAVEDRIEDFRRRISEGTMTEELFKSHITTEFPTSEANDEYGYYFSASSAYSQNFSKESGSEIVKLALSMPIGEYRECELDIGTCFIYRCPLEEGAYMRYAISHFFDDFYVNATPYVYSKSLDSYNPSVKVKKKYDRAFVMSQPYNYELGISFA